MEMCRHNLRARDNRLTTVSNKDTVSNTLGSQSLVIGFQENWKDGKYSYKTKKNYN